MNMIQVLMRGGITQIQPVWVLKLDKFEVPEPLGSMEHTEPNPSSQHRQPTYMWV